MRSRSRHAHIAALAVLFLALPAAAVWMRVTVHFLATFDLSGSPGGSPPLAADAGAIIVSGPGFSVVPGSGGGSSLLAQGTASPLDTTLTALFDSVNKSGELTLTWNVTPGQGSASASLCVMEENDSEIIDVTWDDGGWVSVGGLTADVYQEGVEYDCKLVLKDALLGLDTWTFTMTPANGPTITKTGLLLLVKPMAIDSVLIVLPAGSTGSFVFDDIQATSNSSTYK